MSFIETEFYMLYKDRTTPSVALYYCKLSAGLSTPTGGANKSLPTRDFNPTYVNIHIYKTTVL